MGVNKKSERSFFFLDSRDIGLYETVEILPVVIPKIGPIGLIGPICFLDNSTGGEKTGKTGWVKFQLIN